MIYAEYASIIFLQLKGIQKRIGDYMRIGIFSERLPDRCNICGKKAEYFIKIIYFFQWKSRYACQKCHEDILKGREI